MLNHEVSLGVGAQSVIWRPRRRGWRGAVFSIAAGLSALWALALAGSAAALPSNCSRSGSTVTCTFSSTGGEQTFAVPAAVTALTITAAGAPGAADASGDPGGYGARVAATVPVNAGAKLYVEVGGSSGVGNGGGFNGGGSTGEGGGGGGASDLRTCSIATCSLTTRDTRLVVAGGGGGGGLAYGTGGRAGNTQVAGPGAGGNATGIDSQPGADGGFGGTSGGAGGPGESCNGGSGTLGQGGNGDTSCDTAWGGGGGGGYYGGGAGGSWPDAAISGGGGAGSSFWVTGAMNHSMNEDSTGTPSVTISYRVAGQNDNSEGQNNNHQR